MNNDNLISVDLGDDDIFADFKNKDGSFKRPPLSVVILVSSFCLMIICGLVLGGFVVYETYPDDPTTTTTQTPATTSTPEPTTTTSYPTVNERKFNRLCLMSVIQNCLDLCKLQLFNNFRL